MILYKRGLKYWNFEDNGVIYTPSKFTINTISNDVYIVYENNLKSKKYNISEITLTDLIGGGSFTFGNVDLFMQKLEDLNCPCFILSTNINPAEYDLSDFNNASADPFVRESELPPAVTIDATPTDGSANAVSSNGVFDALATKLSNNLVDYADATLPIADADDLLINQGGVWKKVNKSDIITGGGGGGWKQILGFPYFYFLTNSPSRYFGYNHASSLIEYNVNLGTDNVNLIVPNQTTALGLVNDNSILNKISFIATLLGGNFNNVDIAIFTADDVLGTNALLIYNGVNLSGKVNIENLNISISKNKVLHFSIKCNTFITATNFVHNLQIFLK
jgi:hypothetical protein